MYLNLQRPLLVITGAWNPAVFQVPWMAVNLFGKKRGDTVSVTHIQLQDRPDLLTYFGDIGIGVSQRRIDLFANNFDDNTKRALEGTCVKLIELLPHTPMDGFGANFIFEESDPDPGLIDS